MNISHPSVLYHSVCICYKAIIEPRHEISNNVVCATSKASQSDQSLGLTLEYSMSV